ncbi:MAG: type II toxin-antitoxin system RelE/ParE family toxin [bacterium]
MAYKVLYHHLVYKEDLSPIPAKGEVRQRRPANIKKRIKEAIEQRLIKEPIFAGKPLRQSLKGHRKMRVGDYRVIYRIEKDTIVVLKIGHRKDVYEKVWGRIN